MSSKKRPQKLETPAPLQVPPGYVVRELFGERVMVWDDRWPRIELPDCVFDPNWSPAHSEAVFDIPEAGRGKSFTIWPLPTGD